MSISSSAHKPKGAAATTAGEGAVAPPITLSERSSTGPALLRILVGYLWFQQLFWKVPPTFAGLYGYVVRESQHAGVAGARPGGCSSGTQTGRRSLAGAAPAGSRAALSLRSHRELVCVGRGRARQCNHSAGGSWQEFWPA
jgi:hypothetical protein